MIKIISPIDSIEFASPVKEDSYPEIENKIHLAEIAFKKWRKIPAPIRGEFVRKLGNEFRDKKENLAHAICLDVGKTKQEALGEVQEVIDICDFAVGLSRQLHGLTIASERPQHRMMEQWHPLGPIGIITAFNFPMAVWAWNAMLAFVCGDSVIWKPSEKAIYCAQMCSDIVNDIAISNAIPNNLSQIVVGATNAGRQLANSSKIPLISATGSVDMGKQVAITVGSRLGRCLLELGGNNAAIITPSANLDLAIRSVVFSAVGTAGQRCTTLRRLIVHESIFNRIVDALKKAYDKLIVGNPLKQDVHVGPLIDENAYLQMQATINAFNDYSIHGGERVPSVGGYYVRPALIINPFGDIAEIINRETFAPILHVLRYESLNEAIDIQNSVPQGLSSAIFTQDVNEAELFCSAIGSDCGISNVNIGTSGAEIGGAFGGEKDTGGGRESGSDSWKNYMRRTTNTINYSLELPLAQGIKFDI